MAVAIFLKSGDGYENSTEIYRKETPFVCRWSELMVSFGLLTATVIFGILSIVKNGNKK